MLHRLGPAPSPSLGDYKNAFISRISYKFSCSLTLYLNIQALRSQDTIHKRHLNILKSSIELYPYEQMRTDLQLINILVGLSM